MLAKELITEAILPLRTSVSADDALQIMRDLVVRHLPIVNNLQYLGLVSEDDLLAGDPDAALGSFELTSLKTHVNENDHVVEVMRVMGQARLTVIPVLDRKGNYVGVITQEDILAHFATATSLAENGSVIILEVNRRDYMPGEIGRIIEGEDGVILLLYLGGEPGSEVLEVTLKLHAPSIARIVSSLERFNYRVKASYQESDLNETLEDNYKALLHYLDI
jgi:acetoin utilization protein AcuB